jgi:hypothetical protein
MQAWMSSLSGAHFSNLLKKKKPIEKHDYEFQNGNKNENEVYSEISRRLNSVYYSDYKTIMSHLHMQH